MNQVLAYRKELRQEDWLRRVWPVLVRVEAALITCWADRETLHDYRLDTQPYVYGIWDGFRVTPLADDIAERDMETERLPRFGDPITLTAERLEQYIPWCQVTNNGKLGFVYRRKTVREQWDYEHFYGAEPVAPGGYLQLALKRERDLGES